MDWLIQRTNTMDGTMHDQDSNSQSQGLEQVAAAVAERLARGSSPETIVHELTQQGWPADAAKIFVQRIHEQWPAQASQRPPSINLSERFPQLRPIESAPSLFTLNGVGFGIYGSRDHDPETNSYIKTHCLCVLFIPLLAFRAYRVMQAPQGQGWYFLGREPLSA